MLRFIVPSKIVALYLCIKIVGLLKRICPIPTPYFTWTEIFPLSEFAKPRIFYPRRQSNQLRPERQIYS